MSAIYRFEDNVVEATFKGDEFYELHKDDQFLSDVDVVEKILCQGKRLRAAMKAVLPGHTLTIEGAVITQQLPLIVKKGGEGVTIEDDEYTLNRLTGMCAAYAAKSTDHTFRPKCAMGISLGINMAAFKCLYYAATPGSEHFTKIFGHLPLICALRQVSLNKVPKESITRMASIKMANGKTLTVICK